MKRKYIFLSAITVVILSGVAWALYLYNKPHRGVAGLSAEARAARPLLPDMKKFILLGGIVLIAILGGLAGCAKQSEDVLAARTGAGQCDTTAVSYTARIVPILQANCYEYHGSGSSSGSGGILLQGYSNLLPWAKNGYLAGCVSHAAGFVAMPYLEPALSDCEINTIVAWVNQGANDN